jgi:mono/diheme cytochrome c family protein
MRIQRCKAFLVLGFLAGFGWAPHGQAQQANLAGAKAFQEHCAACHGSDPAKFLSRVIKRGDERFLLKKNGKPVDAFLSSHGAADSGERENLIRLMREVLGP